jgi:tetratricopeptide (TPR) repeat protein
LSRSGFARARTVRAAIVLAAIAPAARARGQEPSPPPDPTSSELTTGGLGSTGLEDDRRARLEAALRSGAYDEAQALLAEAVQREPNSPDLLKLLGGVFFVQGRPLNAAIAFKKAEALAPLDERSRFTLAMAYVAMKKREWARPELDKLVAAFPRSPLYLYWTARLDYDDGQYADAVKRLLRVVELDPGYVKAHDNLGLCYDALGQTDEAERRYREAIRLDRTRKPRSPWPTLNLGILLLRQDRVDEAESLFHESVESDPKFPQGHYQLGIALEKKGRAADAIVELQEASRLDPAYAEPQYALARVFRRQGDTRKADEALALFQKLKREKGQAGPGSP